MNIIKLKYKKNLDEIHLTILHDKPKLTKEEEKQIKNAIYKNIICNSKNYVFDMIEYNIRELIYKNITLYNIIYSYFMINMCNKKAYLLLTY